MADHSGDLAVEVTTLRDDLKILRNRFNSLLGEMTEIKELARGTIDVTSASRDELIATIGLLKMIETPIGAVTLKH